MEEKTFKCGINVLVIYYEYLKKYEKISEIDLIF